MALLQIAEPGQSAAPHQHKLAVGIDLGTTNSLVATVRSGSSETLSDCDGQVLFPSVVHFGEAGEIQVGRSALEKAVEDPLNTVASVKRMMGKAYDEVVANSRLEIVAGDAAQGRDKVPYIRTRDGDKSALEVSAEILKYLYQIGLQSLGDEIDGAVITVPAYFDDAQRQATKDAATLAGIKVLRLLNEPTAAAVAYGLDHQASGIHAIYDLGGGTFDISILSLNKGVFEVLATGGDSALGGDDFDHAIAQWIKTQASFENLNHQQNRYLLSQAKKLKESLTDADTVAIQLDQYDLSWRGELNRQQFAQLVDPFIERTLKACKRAMRDADVGVEEIEQVVMVGGSTRSLRVRQRVAELFHREPLVSIDPDRVVALGAAIQADALVGNKTDNEMLLLDVLPLSLGIETMGGLVEKIIARNTAIPVSKAQEFTTYKDGQTSMSIHVLQGEREMVADCRSLAKFVLKGIPPAVAGAAKIRVVFQVDADGLLTVSAEELSSGSSTQVEVKPSYGLSETDIRLMLQESFTSAAADAESRALKESQVDAERLLLALEGALQEDEALLNPQEIQALRSEMNNLRQLIQAGDRQAIDNGVESLNQASEAFAAIRMNTSIEKALTGKRIDSMEDSIE